MAQADHDRRIDYIELPATDMAATRAFYEQAFGWQFQSWGDEYFSFEDGRLAGGLRKAESNTTGGPLVVIYALDLAAIHEQVTAAGGRISVDTFSFPGGRRFQFLDPSDNELAVWTDQGLEADG